MKHTSTLKTVKLQDGVFAPRQKTGADVTIPECIRKCEETGRLRNFTLNMKEGEPEAHIYHDSDVAKVLEGMAEMLAVRPDEAMEKRLDELVDLVISAQQEDGYLNTYFTFVKPEKRWACLNTNHELYCAGHLMEAAVAHYELTGNRKFLDCMCRYADYIAKVFGTAPGQKRGYPGHQEIELALVKLYRATGEKRYLELSKYFLDERGREPFYFSREEKPIGEDDDVARRNLQSHQPVREQTRATGHAVRAVYLYSGMVDVALETGDQELMDAAIRLFDNIADSQMYITGGIGSQTRGESFSYEYGLPNETAYAESCAAIGLVLFAKRLLDATNDRKYADVMERALYNNCLSGISLSGKEFFYTNELFMNDPGYKINWGGKSKKRSEWFSCSCCPTNYCRFLPQLADFCYSATPEKLRIDVPAAAVISTKEYEAELKSGYPYDGKIELQIKRGGAFEIALRIPGWCSSYTVFLNGKPCQNELQKGYLILSGEWKNGDTVFLDLEMPVAVVYADPRVTDDAGKCAIQRGPVVYCLETEDNPGILIHGVRLTDETEFQLEPARDLPEGTVAIRFQAAVPVITEGALYRTTPIETRMAEVCAIPYALWQNRSVGSMNVFILAK